MKDITQWLDTLYSDWRSLNVLDALDILVGPLDHAELHFKYNHKFCPITDLYCNPEIFNLPARSFMLEWLGGPPRSYTWFRASFLALVVDRCLYAMVQGCTSEVHNAISMAEQYGCYKTKTQSCG
jgi:hypothetical protein